MANLSKRAHTFAFSSPPLSLIPVTSPSFLFPPYFLFSLFKSFQSINFLSFESILKIFNFASSSLRVKVVWMKIENQATNNKIFIKTFVAQGTREKKKILTLGNDLLVINCFKLKKNG